MPRYATVFAVLAAMLLTPQTASAQRASSGDLAGSGRFDRFAALVEKTGAIEPDTGWITVFAPTNQAFGRLPAALRSALFSDAASSASRRSIIRAHVVRGWQAKDHLPVELETVGGNRLLVCDTDGALTLRLASAESIGVPGAMRGNRGAGARVRAGGSVRAGRLLVHPIDRVLLPESLFDSREGPKTGAPRRPDAAAAEEPSADAVLADAIADVDDGPTGSIVPEAVLAETPPDPVAGPGSMPASPQDGEVVTLDPVALLSASVDAQPDNAGSQPEDSGTSPGDAATETTGRAKGGHDSGTGDDPATLAEKAESTALSQETGRELSLTRPVAVSGLLDSVVRDEAGKKMGELTDLMMALATGEVQTVVIATDTGMAGLGETGPRRVPLDRLSINPLTGAVILSAGNGKDAPAGEGE